MPSSWRGSPKAMSSFFVFNGFRQVQEVLYRYVFGVLLELTWTAPASVYAMDSQPRGKAERTIDRNCSGTISQGSGPEQCS